MLEGQHRDGEPVTAAPKRSQCTTGQFFWLYYVKDGADGQHAPTAFQ